MLQTFERPSKKCSLQRCSHEVQTLNPVLGIVERSAMVLTRSFLKVVCFQGEEKAGFKEELHRQGKYIGGHFFHSSQEKTVLTL